MACAAGALACTKSGEYCRIAELIGVVSVVSQYMVYNCVYYCAAGALACTKSGKDKHCVYYMWVLLSFMYIICGFYCLCVRRARWPAPNQVSIVELIGVVSVVSQYNCVYYCDTFRRWPAPNQVRRPATK
jgi:hypothetical protein